MSHFIIILALVFTGCSSKLIQIDNQEIVVKKSKNNSFLKAVETPFFFKMKDKVYAAVFWQNENEVQPSGKIIFEADNNKQILKDNVISPCNKIFYTGIDTKESFIIKDSICFKD